MHNDDHATLHAAREAAELAGMAPAKAQNLQLATAMGFTLAYRPASSDEAVLRHSFENDIFLSGVPEYQPQDSHVVLDIGAHMGDFSLLLAGQVARVYAIEARLETFALLKTNLFLNGIGNVIADHAALADNTGYARLYHAAEGESWGDSTTFDFKGPAEPVPALTLARYLFERNIPHVDFAKFNCEGAEFSILPSAEPETLARIGTVLVLYHCDLASGATDQALHQKLRHCGFTTTARNQSEDRGWIIATRN